jgi:hypothetical protein
MMRRSLWFTIYAFDHFVICCEAGFRDLLRFGFGYTIFALYQNGSGRR